MKIVTNLTTGNIPKPNLIVKMDGGQNHNNLRDCVTVAARALRFAKKINVHCIKK